MNREDEKKYTLDEYNWHIINNLREFNDKPNMIKDLYDKMRYNLPEHTILSKFYDIYETGLKYYDEHSTFPDIKWFEVNYAKSGKLKRTNDEFSIQVYEDCVKKVDMEIKEDKDFLFATKQARLATFLENDEERRMFRNVIYNAIKWGKRH